MLGTRGGAAKRLDGRDRPCAEVNRDPEDETMTLRFIVARILRELIELAESDADAELVDALHDALDVVSPAGRLQH